MDLKELIACYREGNPFAERAAKARLRYEKLSRPSARHLAMVESFPLGVGYDGSKAAGRRIDASIKKAKNAVETKCFAERLELQAATFDEGKINAQGRSISMASLARSEKREAQKEKREARIAAAKAQLAGKECWEVTA